MCRWLAYSGTPIYLDDIIIKPKHSLIDQSLHSRAGATTTNGDGFGLGWYARGDEPGVYKSIQPAWNDGNLHALAEQIKSPMFMAHIRATTGTAVQQSNCHPFKFKNWIFVHNGAIRSFPEIKRDLVMAISPQLYPHIQGSTDSEVMFFLALSFGMADDVAQGVARMVGFIERVGAEKGIENPVQMSLGICDGQSLYAFRYSTEGQSRSLFHSIDMEALRQLAPHLEDFSDDARAIVSEPLSDLPEAWVPVPESSFLTARFGEIECQDFVPEQR